MVLKDLQDLLQLTPKTYILFILGDWNAKVGSQKIPGITGKFGLGVQNETGETVADFIFGGSKITADGRNTWSNRQIWPWNTE